MGGRFRERSLSPFAVWQMSTSYGQKSLRKRGQKRGQFLILKKGSDIEKEKRGQFLILIHKAAKATLLAWPAS